VDDTIENVGMMIIGFQIMADEVEHFKSGAIEIEDHVLTIHAKKAMEGLNGIVSRLDEIHSAISKEIGVVHVPVTDGNRPKLTLVRGGRT